MLRRIHSIRPYSYSSRRLYSTPSSTSPYGDTFKNNKLRAYPFQVTPKDALKQMGTWANVLGATTNGGLIYSLFVLLSAVWAPRQLPKRWSAVYFPAWIIDAEVEGWEKTQGMVAGTVRNAYIPGSDTPLLSAAPLWGPEFEAKDAFPFTEDLLHQQGQEVQYIPFNISPFSPLRLAQSADDSQSSLWNIIEDLSISPTSLNTTMYAARPVLLPIYLAQYQIGDNPENLRTFFTSGYQDPDDVMTANIRYANPALEEVHEALSVIKYFNIGKAIDLTTDVFRFIAAGVPPKDPIRVSALLPEKHTKQAHTMTRWLVGLMKYSSNISKLASADQFESDDDPRIREMTEDAEDELNAYFKEATEYRVMAKVFEHGDVRKDDDRYKNIVEKQLQLKPRWWTEWEKSSQPKPK